MTLVDSVEAGRLTISELIDALAKDKITQLPDGISDTVHLRLCYSKPQLLLSLQQMVWSNSFGMSVTTALQVFARAFHP